MASMMPTILPALAFAILATMPVEPITLTDVTVTRSYPVSVDCGILKLWGVIEFRHEGATGRAYVPCAGADDLPRANARCSLTLHRETISEVTADNRKTPFADYVVDAMTCDPPVSS